MLQAAGDSQLAAAEGDLEQDGCAIATRARFGATPQRFHVPTSARGAQCGLAMAGRMWHRRCGYARFRIRHGGRAQRRKSGAAGRASNCSVDCSKCRRAGGPASSSRARAQLVDFLRQRNGRRGSERESTSHALTEVRNFRGARRLKSPARSTKVQVCLAFTRTVQADRPQAPERIDVDAWLLAAMPGLEDCCRAEPSCWSSKTIAI